MNIYSPYTYLLSWTSLDKHYYGVRHARRCSPKDLWVSYFSSSNEVKKYRKLYGEPDIIEVRKVFESGDAARLWEQKVLKRLNAARSNKWLNKNNSDGKFYNKGHTENTKQKLSILNIGKKWSIEAIQKRELTKKIKGIRTNVGRKLSTEHKNKIKKAMEGRELTSDWKAKIGLSNRGKTRSAEQKAANSSKHKGTKRPPRSEEHRRRLSEANQGKKHSPETREKLRLNNLMRKYKNVNEYIKYSIPFTF